MSLLRQIASTAGILEKNEAPIVVEQKTAPQFFSEAPKSLVGAIRAGDDPGAAAPCRCGCPVWWRDPYGRLACWDCDPPVREAQVRSLETAVGPPGGPYAWQIEKAAEWLTVAAPPASGGPCDASAAAGPGNVEQVKTKGGTIPIEVKPVGWFDKWWASLFDPSGEIKKQPCQFCGGRRFWKFADDSGEHGGRCCATCRSTPTKAVRKKREIVFYEV